MPPSAPHQLKKRDPAFPGRNETDSPNQTKPEGKLPNFWTGADGAHLNLVSAKGVGVVVKQSSPKRCLMVGAVLDDRRQRNEVKAQGLTNSGPSEFRGKSGSM